MSQYMIPAYIGISGILCCVYSLIECIKGKGQISTPTYSILCSWCIACLITVSGLTIISGEMMIQQVNPLHMILVCILVCATLSISSCMVSFWS